MQAGQAGRGEAFTPQADGMAIAAEVRGDLLIMGPVVIGSAQDKPAAKDEGVGRGACADEGLQLLVGFWGKDDARPEGTWHERPPCGSVDQDAAVMLIVGRP